LNPPAICIEYYASLKEDFIERFDISAGLLAIKETDESKGCYDYTLFSDDEMPYLDYRISENLFCKSFKSPITQSSPTMSCL